LTGKKDVTELTLVAHYGQPREEPRSQTTNLFRRMTRKKRDFRWGGELYARPGPGGKVKKKSGLLSKTGLRCETSPKVICPTVLHPP